MKVIVGCLLLLNYSSVFSLLDMNVAYSDTQPRYTCTHCTEEGNMTTIILGGFSGIEIFDVKTIDIKISENHYLKNIYYSTDDMKTWTLMYKIKVQCQHDNL